MKPETRIKYLFSLLKLNKASDTIHDACQIIDVNVNDFVHGNAVFDESGPNSDFRRGYAEAENINIAANRGNVQYWLGAVSNCHNKSYHSE